VLFAPQSWRYDFEASIGATRVQSIEAQRTVDLVIEFADAVVAKAGVLHWAETTRYASALASCSGNSGLTPKQSRKAADPHLLEVEVGADHPRPRMGQVPLLYPRLHAQRSASHRDRERLRSCRDTRIGRRVPPDDADRPADRRE